MHSDETILNKCSSNLDLPTREGKLDIWVSVNISHRNLPCLFSLKFTQFMKNLPNVIRGEGDVVGDLISQLPPSGPTIICLLDPRVNSSIFTPQISASSRGYPNSMGVEVWSIKNASLSQERWQITKDLLLDHCPEGKRVGRQSSKSKQVMVEEIHCYYHLKNHHPHHHHRHHFFWEELATCQPSNDKSFPSFLMQYLHLHRFKSVNWHVVKKNSPSFINFKTFFQFSDGNGTSNWYLCLRSRSGLWVIRRPTGGWYFPFRSV